MTTEEAVADLDEWVQAQFNDTNASVNVNSSAIARLDGYAAARWSVLTNVNGQIAGLVLHNAGASISSFTVIANSFFVCWPGVACLMRTKTLVFLSLSVSMLRVSRSIGISRSMKRPAFCRRSDVGCSKVR